MKACSLFSALMFPEMAMRSPDGDLMRRGLKWQPTHDFRGQCQPKQQCHLNLLGWQQNSYLSRWENSTVKDLVLALMPCDYVACWRGIHYDDDGLYIGHGFICSSNGEPRHGGKYPRCHHRTEPTTETINKLVEQIWPKCCSRQESRPPHGEVAMDPSRLSSTTQITPASPRHTSPPPRRSLNRTPSTKASRNINPPQSPQFPRRNKETSKEFDLQEAVTNIGVQRIIDSVKEQ